ncbi:hypothetical protein P2G88_12675 [Aliiglaciecola sp. CAU 1673]|uniref:hypothetical protein n=1 Tax=Aliiglaciecola sp. CAU 1673 TaxID=3032595 RepID=UPI0023D9A053|nr:hypothetical protein [Aliiglaciecola sp. CAU 1673]MDF2179106.1 hypothetical protein [Aliiglaciecola sp. CAU 1673]
MRTSVVLILCLLTLPSDSVSAEPVESFFDFNHIKQSLAYLKQPSAEKLQRISATAAAMHLKNHADHTGYFPKSSSPLQITEQIVGRAEKSAAEIVAIEKLAVQIESDLAGQQGCVEEVSKYLPEDFSFEGNLFFTFGYDIGVAMGKDASLNLAHPHFLKLPEEVWYYFQELHHVGFQSIFRFSLG